MSSNHAVNPFPLIETPLHKLGRDGRPDEFDHMASIMATVHNIIIRGLNTIVIRAPTVRPDEELAFLNYSVEWHNFVHGHHTHEEMEEFPYIEEACGEKGLMDPNIQQHHAFLAGADTFRAYLNRCLDGKEKYSSETLVKLVNDFGGVLTQHLRDEIETLLALKRFGEPVGAELKKRINDGAAEQMKKMGLTTTITFALHNHDVDYEDGLWATWPPAPTPLLWFLRNLAWIPHRSWWAFASCDHHGHRKELVDE